MRWRSAAEAKRLTSEVLVALAALSGACAQKAPTGLLLPRGPAIEAERGASLRLDVRVSADGGTEIDCDYTFGDLPPFPILVAGVDRAIAITASDGRRALKVDQNGLVVIGARDARSPTWRGSKLRLHYSVSDPPLSEMIQRGSPTEMRRRTSRKNATASRRFSLGTPGPRQSSTTIEPPLCATRMHVPLSASTGKQGSARRTTFPMRSWSLKCRGFPRPSRRTGQSPGQTGRGDIGASVIREHS
jgi:hypothetical protein